MAFYVWVPMYIWRGSEELFHSFIFPPPDSQGGLDLSCERSSHLRKQFLLVSLFFGGGGGEGVTVVNTKKKNKGRESWLWLIVSEPLVCGWQTALLGSVVRQNSTVERCNREELPTSERPAKGEASNWARDKVFLKGIILIDRLSLQLDPYLLSIYYSHQHHQARIY